MRVLLFFTVVAGALAGFNWFVHSRAAAAFDLQRRGRRVLAAVMVLGIAALVLRRPIGQQVPSLVAEIVGTLGGGIQLAVVLSFFLLLPERLAVAIARGARRIRTKRPVRATTAAVASAPDEVLAASEDVAATDDIHAPDRTRATDDDIPAPALRRRELLTRGAAGMAITVGSGSAAYATLFGRHDYAVEEVPIALERLPGSLDGFTIAQLSDIHFGMFVGEAEARAAIELVRKAKPDLVVLTGDLIDHDPRYAPLLGSLVRRLGDVAPVAAVPGNHDHYTGLHTTVQVLRRAGARVLMNQHQLIGDAGGKLALVGVDDVMGRRWRDAVGPDLARATTDLPRDLPRVLLCHNPSFFAEAAPHVDLQLSGHTHGGQVTLGINPAALVLPHGYIRGHYRRGESQIYVNRGFGTAGPPARIGSAPEVTKLVLTA
jgi:predicted MPP superfamily phosphohydrolase